MIKHYHILYICIHVYLLVGMNSKKVIFLITLYNTQFSFNKPSEKTYYGALGNIFTAANAAATVIGISRVFYYLYYPIYYPLYNKW